MLTKAQIKLIGSLTQKKQRIKQQCFVVEGVKGIREFLNSDFELDSLYGLSNTFGVPELQFTTVSSAELKKISGLTTPNQALAVFKMPKPLSINEQGLIVALDDVRDPGNLGTIIRLCDWYGVKELVCSHNTVDCFNQKVVQATMGSLTRVNINYVDLEEFLKHTELTTFGTFMDGDNVYTQSLPSSAVIVMGNEANGISDAIAGIVNSRLSIPRFGALQATESLNVAMATSILLSEFKRGDFIEK
ncbi:MAG: RNA methyltransferase [Bacteroidetes bacterium MedPE-SWsnd-G2]|mgnify:CR=1 FL=1|nr:MAG: RNA methyltransferase [Bacteroidetes bacterium MedPE-SWsnd-G2]